MQINEVDQCSFPFKIAFLISTCINNMVKLKQVHKKIKKEAKKLTKQRYIERFHKILIHKHKIPKKVIFK